MFRCNKVVWCTRYWIAGVLMTLVALFGCRPSVVSTNVHILVDGRDIPLSTSALTVREALEEAGVIVGTDDRVQPDLWVELQDGLSIRVIRVQEEILVERELVPYTQQTIKSEALPAGAQKLLQAGQNGQVEVTYRLRFEDGVEVARSILQRIVVTEAVSQIIAVGVQGVAESATIEGTMVYLNSGNAWMMRGESGGRHAVTAEGNLDGRVFALSPTGAYLLYSVPTDTVAFDGPFNELYLLNIRLVNEKPVRLPLQNVLWAGWSPDGRQIAYTTGVKSASPGWKANNDLLLTTLLGSDGDVLDPEPKRILRSQTVGAYSWWGTQYLWSSDGKKLASARPDQVGWIDLASVRMFPLASFSSLGTQRNQVWLPTVTWSPDSAYVAAVVHGAPEPGQSPEASQRFEIWAFSLDQTVRARLGDAVGMWAAPQWSPRQGGESQIAYAQAVDPFNSYESRYEIKVMDRDGSNKRSIFPVEGQIGIAPPINYVWSPSGKQIAVLYLGDVYLVDLDGGQVQQLTGDGQCVQLDWKR